MLTLLNKLRFSTDHLRCVLSDSKPREIRLRTTTSVELVIPEVNAAPDIFPPTPSRSVTATKESDMEVVRKP